ncbi:hypothetical protein [Glycomyces paridis]|uniref:Uncharacterized protein n=1 Tax=Glycomyces paridis TaxID=2126555 RepID=A0A4S8P0U3_9ACTN|nr:hypothetical protein [Glycomyces paridis]THV23548.1 hypothetical protein E9998_22380 [Glycomyces paridis]
MFRSDPELLVTLRALDDPDRFERPLGFDLAAAEARHRLLTARLEADFATTCETMTDMVETSEFGRVQVPAAATARGTRLVVSVSAFWPVALVSADNPAAYFGAEDAHAEGVLDLGDFARVVRALDDLGYTAVPEELLNTDYDGPSVLRAERPDWYERFFGYS